MFTSKSCYYATYRATESLPEDSTAVRVGVALKTLDNKQTQVVTTCGVVKSVYPIVSGITKEVGMEIHLDDGIDEILVYFKQSPSITVDLGEVLLVQVTNEQVIRTDGLTFYYGIVGEKIGEVEKIDFQNDIIISN